MAHLWTREQLEWGLRSLDTPGALPFPLDDITPAWITRSNGAVNEVWLLVGSAALHVNGAPLRTGVCVLRDQDEIVIPNTPPRYFSTERLAVIETFPGASHPVQCPRCKRPIVADESVVRCPRPACRLAHHQMADWLCWTYDVACAGCQGPTGLADTYGWHPEVLP